MSNIIYSVGLRFQSVIQVLRQEQKQMSKNYTQNSILGPAA